ncbi:S8 family serine peptidase [Actinomadura mexicana]|uniref:Type VII secretion-associated serine protease mycosin n=1 Tax=Actinomadura mexicana TaxID=134959 RepID=A0A239BK73_9ACTN|nr:S8 family serine peptidase [Actinomadura mexicana]SNS07999.1 type VII secretion-associated serine protease mycosin [Actinomadura mexicana]
MLRRAAAGAAALALALAPAAPAARAAGPRGAALASDPVRDAVTPVLETLNVPRAWETSKGGGTTVAVLDSGVDAGQADLAGSVTAGPDYTRGANPPGVAPKRLHGTNMASIIAGHGHGPGGAEGVVGVAPGARLLSLRVILERDEPGFAEFTGGGRYTGTIAQGIRYAVDHGADVVNLSLGRSYPTPRERDAVAYAISRNVVVVAAAGNSGAEDDPRGVGGRSAPARGARRPGSGGSARYFYPASFPGVVSVAAVDARGRHAGFSNRNSGVVVSAPGVQIIGAGPDGRYWIGDGTSPATAFVSGVAALIRSRHRGLAPALVTQAIVASTGNRPARGYDRGVGFGRVDAAAALAASDTLAGARTGGAGLPAGKRFATGPVRPVQVVHRSGGLVLTYLLICALSLLGLAGAAVLVRGERDPGE